MSLANLSDVLNHAKVFGYAVGSFTVWNLEYARVVIETAEELESPVIVQVGPLEAAFSGLEPLGCLLRHFAERSSVPVVLHLDHSTGLPQIMSAIRAGFTSVMFDGSHFPYEKNVEITARMAEIAHGAGVSLEGELGTLAGGEGEFFVEEGEAVMTDPLQAAEFVKLTGVDALAVSVGTVHGIYRSAPKIDEHRFEEISRAVGKPLVLHGGSGTPDEVIKRLIKFNLRKLNVATDLQIAFARGLRQGLTNESTYDPRAILSPAMDNVRQVVRNKIELLGSAGKAMNWTAPEATGSYVRA